MLRDVEEHVWRMALRELRPKKNAHRVIAMLKRIGYLVGVVTGGFNIVIEWLGLNKILDIQYSNILSFRSGKPVFKILVADKGVVVDEIRRKYDPCFIVAVGDGYNDIPMFVKSDFSIAFNPKTSLEKYVDVVVKRDDLRLVYALAATVLKTRA